MAAHQQTVKETSQAQRGGRETRCTEYPDTALPCIKALPTTALFDGARAALLSGRIDPLYSAELLTAAVVSFFLAVRFFDKRIHG